MKKSYHWAGPCLAFALVSVLSQASVYAEKWVPGSKAETRVWYSYGERVSAEQALSSSFGAMLARESDTTLIAGWFGQVEPGLRGGKVSLGFGVMNLDEPRWWPTRFAAGAKLSP